MEIIEENVDAAEPRRGRPAKYPWDKWLQNGKKVRLFHGDDFDVEPESLRPQIHIAADRRKGKASKSCDKARFGEASTGDVSSPNSATLVPISLSNRNIISLR